MDEGKLTELLRDAVSDAPPPSFDEHDVARESQRQRLRRRNGILAGSSFGVVLLASATALGMALWTGSNSAETASDSNAAASAGGNANASPYELPQEDGAHAPKPEREEVPQNAPSESRKQGRPSSGDAGPAGPGGTPSGCEADRELAAALAGELPAAADVTKADAQSVELSCPEGSKGAMFRVVDDGQAGAVSAVIVQPGITPPEWSDLPQGSQRASDNLADGRMVVVISEPSLEGEVAPFGDEVQQIATEIAQGL